ncbi:hypothetical protein BGZ51_003397 [Haplosporangium sp. Z 767]|nr:hypothetical protein BGZ51_003397 [Haplosporangium sp. Z 767]
MDGTTDSVPTRSYLHSSIPHHEHSTTASQLNPSAVQVDQDVAVQEPMDVTTESGWGLGGQDPRADVQQTEGSILSRGQGGGQDMDVDEEPSGVIDTAMHVDDDMTSTGQRNTQRHTMATTTEEGEEVVPLVSSSLSATAQFHASGQGSSSTASGTGTVSGSADAGATTTTADASEPTSTSRKTESGIVADERAQSELRRKIMDIQRDPSISFADKAGMIQRLMSSRWQESRRSAESQNDGSVEATEDDLKKTFYNEELNQLGCKHYRRGCKLKANCCGKWFNCRFCHDDVSDHAIVRKETKTMLCMHCKTIQDAAQTCSSCNATLAVYYCDACKLWDDDPKRHIYHCDDCGICRIGQGLGRDYFHCKKCNVCMNIRLQNNHKCIERNLECDCPICGEYMFTSTSTVIFMPCGHCIHSRCHEDYIKTSYQCPTCWKALGDMSAYYSKIDSLLAEQTMPAEYANIFSIVLCNDCEVKSEAPYHFLYHKCDECKGYNTKVLETFKRVSDGQVQVVENATASGAMGTVPENNISGSCNSTNGGGSGSGSGVGAGASSSSSSSATPAATSLSGTTTSILNVGVPRSPLMDENASSDMAIVGISDNSAT